MKILVVGGGIGGLAAANCLARKGHDVRVLESNEGLSEFGAGLEITPNASRLLDAWGLREAFNERVLEPDAAVARRYNTDEVIGRSPQNPDSTETYGYPRWQIYRPDFQQLLADGAIQAGSRIEYGKQVIQTYAEAGKVVFMGGAPLVGDLVICADGIRSRSRRLIASNTGAVLIPFEEYSYRAIIPREAMMRDPETAQLITTPNTQAWLGPERAVIAYPVSNSRLFNLGICVARRSDAPIGRWNRPGDIEELRSSFAAFSPLVQKLIKLVETCAKWTVAELPPLTTWSSRSGKTVLLGDAAHAMSPHAAQGNAMAIEDAAVLGECLSRFEGPENVLAAVKAYEAIRRPRVERVQDITRSNGAVCVLPDGAEQEARDKRLKDVMQTYEREVKEIGREGMRAKPKPAPEMHGKWPEPGALMWLYGYDAIKEAQEYLREH